MSAIIWGALRPWESSKSGGGNIDGSKGGLLGGDAEMAAGVWFGSREGLSCRNDGVEGSNVEGSVGLKVLFSSSEKLRLVRIGGGVGVSRGDGS